MFDRVGQDLLAPVLSVKALRDEGVTLHLYIMSERDPVPEVPAIYFCQSTEDNLRRISEDLRANLYGSYYFNFILSHSETETGGPRQLRHPGQRSTAGERVNIV